MTDDPSRDDATRDDSRDDATTYEGWVSAFECSTDFEADLVRDRLDEAGIAAVVLTQRDHSFNLNVGDLSPVHVMVRPEDRTAAAAIVSDTGFTDAELEEAAMAADVMAPDAHDPQAEAMLDSGLDSLSFDVPDDSAAADMADDLQDPETAGAFDPTHTSGPATSHTGADFDPSLPGSDAPGSDTPGSDTPGTDAAGTGRPSGLA